MIYGKIVAIVVVAATFGPLVAAQSLPRFEVASVKLHQRDDVGSSDTNILPGGRFTGSNVTVRKMIRIALGVEDNQMIGAPGWIDAVSYDIEAHAGNAAAISQEQLPQLMQALLEDRFQLQFHRATKELPVYLLEVSKNGPKLKAHSGDSEPSMSTNSQAAITILKATKMPMPSLAGALRRQVGRPVLDRTGLKGDFDVELEWDRDQAPDVSGPSIFTAIQEQLGLRLEAAKGPVEMIVIDRVEMASEN